MIQTNHCQLETHTKVLMDKMIECLKYALKYSSIWVEGGDSGGSRGNKNRKMLITWLLSHIIL